MAGRGCDPDICDGGARDGGARGGGAGGRGGCSDGSDGPGDGCPIGGISACGSPGNPETGTLRDADGGGSGIVCGWLDRFCDGRIVDSCGAT
jgi:hypothetical protein